jgi:hypothetical protein
MSKLIIDIETIGEDFDALDETTQEVMTRWISRESKDDDEYKHALKDIKEGMGFSPLTGEIITIGVFDHDKQKGVVYFQDPSEKLKEFEEDNCVFKPLSEKEMLIAFWKGAMEYQEFITFNGRTFDVPFLMIRSAINGVRPTKDLMTYRYATSQKFGALHIDLLDQLTFYGAVRRKGSLHLWTRAFGIESPKSGGINGDDVGRFFKEGKAKEIALYNARDLVATSELYQYWQDYLRP